MLEALDELRQRPSRLLILSICALVGIAHQATRWDWFIDDAAICFAYARNIAELEGVVPWPGGERIEGISDPLWVALLAVLYAIGLDGFEIAKPLGMLFGVINLGLVWRLARAALPEHDGEGALIAPILLALNAQFAIWSASGLENGLFCLLLSLALLRTLHEVRHGGWPLAALCYLALAWTRPEGILYAALGGLWFAAWTLRSGRGLRPIVTWLAVFWIPSLILEVARLAYFAWPLPNTYYAKIESRGVAPLQWDSKGWAQLREWAGRLWHGWFVPIYLVGLTGVQRRRLAIGASVVGLLALALLWPGPARLRAIWLWPELPPPPEAYVLVRTVGLIGAGLGLPLLAVGLPGGRARVLCGQTLALGLGFSVYANGDWMGAYRWMSLVAVPGTVLLTVGITSVVDALERAVSGSARWDRAGWLAASLLVGVWFAPNASQTRDHAYWNLNETTTSVRERVRYTRSIARRTFHEGPIVNLEVDQGAHLWWAPDYVEVDMAMLVDVSMSRHWYQQRSFIQEYVYEERRPTFAHVGGWWAEHTGLRRYPAWRASYFQLPPYTDPRWNGPFPHVFARRDLLVAPLEREPGRLATFGENDVALHDLRVLAPWVAGGEGYLEAPLSRGALEGDVQLIAFLAGQGRLVTWALEPGHGLLPQARWRPTEVALGRHAVRVPGDLPEGRYDLGVVLLGPGGVVLPADPTPGASAEPPRLAAGEVRRVGIVQIVSDEGLATAISAARAAIDDAAAQGACDEAWARFIALKRHRPRDWRWHAQITPQIHTTLAGCRARLAGDRPDEAAEQLARAHWLDHRSEALARVGEPLAEAWLAEAHAARERGDWETAYRRYSDVLGFQPWRAWARRYAEEARDHRLGLIDDVRIGIGGEDDLRRAEEAGGVP